MRNLKGTLVVAALLAAVLLPVTVSEAAPFVQLKMVLLDGSSTVDVTQVGQIVNYKIVAVMAPVGTSNTSVYKFATSTIVYGPAKPLTMSSLVAGKDGFSTVRFSLRETGDFTCLFAPVALETIFTHGASASPGTAVTNGIDYIKAEIGTSDPKQISEVVIATGSFTVLALPAGIGTSVIGVSTWGDAGGSVGSININNGAVISAKVSNADPFYSFTGLTLTPEPGTIALIILGSVGMVLRRRRKLA